MRYRNDKTGDWVEFKSGLSKCSMAKVLTASNSPSLLAEWISKAEFANPDGAKVSPTDGAQLMDNLTFAQWDWLSSRFAEWARDDAIDPEA